MLAFLDYDGTLTTHECNEVILQRFVGDAWRPLEAEAKADRMSHADVFDRQIGLIQAPREQLIDALVAEARPAPGLHGFLAELEARGGRSVIVSAGIREAIAAVWRREQLPPVELHASELVGRGPGGGPPYSLSFTSVLGDCPRCGPGRCKGAALRSLRRPGEPVLVFGDGASDVCPAREADLVFARDHLAERCAYEGLPWRPLADFTHVWSEVDAWMAAGRI
jgi:HAD superfamily phosphoserine phosphatase-like hydrolase